MTWRVGKNCTKRQRAREKYSEFSLSEAVRSVHVCLREKDPDLRYYIAGHDHRPDMRPLEKKEDGRHVYYLNTGSWIPWIVEGKHQLQKMGQEVQLTFVRLMKGKHGYEADLLPWVDYASYPRPLAEERKNLPLIQERKAKYVLETNIPPQLLKEERHLLKHIEELEQRVEELKKSVPVAVTPALVEGPLAQETLSRLFEILDKRFNKEDLEVFCFHLGISYDDLPGNRKANKVVGLIEYHRQRIRVPELVKTGKRLRPDIPWPEMMSDE